ncbi:TPR end-of-group domain-containing protein [Mucilaginibacter lutimaris]|uniref:TPR end-of-group domain-containing protein n=1 Tax=Mucilaginibacter lutimaris TaxID=931629 RepID=A0ABW2ZFH8_9SPHI
MKLKLTLSAIIIFSGGSLFAQNAPTNPFDKFANNQSGLIQKAYDKRDDAEGLKLMTELVVKYRELNADDKRTYKGYLTNNWYNVSCLYSLINKKAEALSTLDSAVHYGYTNYRHLMEDSDFANIKNEQKFKQIADNVRSVGDYKYILQKAEKFNAKDTRKIPVFTYQPASNANLVAIRKNFKLDSIAGKGDEASKAINILKWVHNTVNHDGQHESGITKINANEIISKATAKKIGVSCGELATTLNECYLAMGWKSRKVYCFPKDSLKVDYDSHVINVVYLPTLSKWVWMDPTNNAYVKDENNKLLSVAEVRERLIKNQPLFVNDDANWNNRQKITREFYLDNYMAKNLYRMYSPLRNEYDYETRDKNKTITYVNLLPVEYFKQSPDKTEEKNDLTNLTIERYRTNNADAFWNVDK